MKALAHVLILMSLVCISAMVMTYDSQALPGDESMVLYLPFDEGEGDKTQDLSQYGHETNFSGEPEWVEGQYGNALEFDAAKFVKVPITTDVLQLRENFTIEFWSKREEIQPNPKWNEMVTVGPTGWLVAFNAGSRFRLYLCTATKGEWATRQYSIYPLPEEWTHVAVVHDITSAITIYYNGEEDARSKTIPTILDENVHAEITIGGFNGVIDELAIYDRALSQEEIQKDMRSVLAVSPSGKLPTAWGSIKTSY